MKHLKITLLILIQSFVFSCSEDSLESYAFHVKATIADHNQHAKIDYMLEVIAKDAPLGNVKWSKTISLSMNDKIIIPIMYKHYTFIASKAGYISHVQHFISEELPNDLSFEFIPESLEGFVMYKSDDNKVTAYFPDDENRCKLYLRFDVAEGCNILYVYADKSAWSRDLESLAETNVKEFLLGKNAVSPDRLNVNIFGNIPFAESPDYCSEIDLTISPVATELADVNMFTVTKIDYMNLTNNQIEMFVPYHSWIGVNNQ